jgi:hypothetical protein
LAIAWKTETLNAAQEAMALKIMQAWYVGMVEDPHRRSRDLDGLLRSSQI